MTDEIERALSRRDDRPANRILRSEAIRAFNDRRVLAVEVLRLRAAMRNLNQALIAAMMDVAALEIDLRSQALRDNEQDLDG